MIGAVTATAVAGQPVGEDSSHSRRGVDAVVGQPPGTGLTGARGRAALDYRRARDRSVREDDVDVPDREHAEVSERELTLGRVGQQRVHREPTGQARHG